MGDEELNFTEDEARCWADDPRNQPYADSGWLLLVIVCIAFVVALIGFALAQGSRSRDGVSHAEKPNVGAGAVVMSHAARPVAVLTAGLRHRPPTQSRTRVGLASKVV
jgi:hypothetical protein